MFFFLANTLLDDNISNPRIMDLAGKKCLSWSQLFILYFRRLQSLGTTVLCLPSLKHMSEWKQDGISQTVGKKSQIFLWFRTVFSDVYWYIADYGLTCALLKKKNQYFHSLVLLCGDIVVSEDLYYKHLVIAFDTISMKNKNEK